MKVRVDPENCEAQGTCVRTCAHVFELDDQDNLTILTDTVPPEHHEAVRRAVARCPKQALSIDED